MKKRLFALTALCISLIGFALPAAAQKKYAAASSPATSTCPAILIPAGVIATAIFPSLGIIG